jgi:hypothetical protein
MGWNDERLQVSYTSPPSVLMMAVDTLLSLPLELNGRHLGIRRLLVGAIIIIMIFFFFSASGLGWCDKRLQESYTSSYRIVMCTRFCMLFLAISHRKLSIAAL